MLPDPTTCTLSIYSFCSNQPLFVHILSTELGNSFVYATRYVRRKQSCIYGWSCRFWHTNQKLHLNTQPTNNNLTHQHPSQQSEWNRGYRKQQHIVGSSSNNRNIIASKLEARFIAILPGHG